MQESNRLLALETSIEVVSYKQERLAKFPLKFVNFKQKIMVSACKYTVSCILKSQSE